MEVDNVANVVAEMVGEMEVDRVAVSWTCWLPRWLKRLLIQFKLRLKWLG